MLRCPSGRTLALAPLLAAAACASTAPAVSRDSNFVQGQGDAIVVGRVSYNSALGEASSYALSFRSVRGGEVFRVKLARQDDLAGVWGAPFFVTMPPGRYMVDEWLVELLAGVSWHGERAPLVIEVRPGEAVCIGQIFLQSASATDVCAALFPAFKQRAPAGVRELKVRLAQPARNGR